MKKERDHVKYLPEEIVMKIMARLPVQSIVRFKLVCREWKSVMESACFRKLYQSNDWSIMHGVPYAMDSRLEQVKLDLPHDDGSFSFASFLTQNKNMMMKEIRVVACTDGLVLLRLKSGESPCYYIGNPVLPQWIQLPAPSVSSPLPSPDKDFTDLGLVTRMHNGALVAYKVIRSKRWTFDIFSSDTGEWSVTRVSDHDGFMCNASNPVSLNGKLLWLDVFRNVIVHDFFSHEFQTICLPARIQGTPHRRFHTPHCCRPSPCQKVILTTSQGSCVLIDVGLINTTESYIVRVWRLESDSWNWEKALEINMASVGLGSMCVPVAINYFDLHIIYLWDLDRKCFVACNLRTHSTSYGTPKDGVVVSRSCRKDGSVRKSCRDGGVVVVYKDNKLCFHTRVCLSQFVPSLQAVPT